MKSYLKRPGRKHPGIHIIAESPQGERFLDIIRSLVGGNPGYGAVASTRDNAHLFWVTGETGVGMLVVGLGHVIDGIVMEPFGFLFKPAAEPVVVHLELDAYRWDPWIWAGYSRDDSFVKLAPRKRSAVRDEKNREVGARQDVLRLTIAADGAVSQEIAGVPLNIVWQLSLELLEGSRDDENSASSSGD